MIRAADRAAERAGGPPACRHELTAAMSADVVEGAEPSVFASDDEDAFAGDISDEVFAGLRYLLGAADAKPIREENAIALAREPIVGDVCRSRQRAFEPT